MDLFNPKVCYYCQSNTPTIDRTTKLICIVEPHPSMAAAALALLQFSLSVCAYRAAGHNVDLAAAVAGNGSPDCVTDPTFSECAQFVYSEAESAADATSVCLVRVRVTYVAPLSTPTKRVRASTRTHCSGPGSEKCLKI